MIDPRCLWRAVWYTLRHPFTVAPISGHNYVLDEEVESASVMVLRCEDCGEHNITWEPR